MEDANIKNPFEELCSRLQCDSYPQLAKALGISSQAVYDAKKNGVIPRSWATIVQEKFKLDISDLIGFKYRQAWSVEKRACKPEQTGMDFQVLGKLIEQLEQERSERLELSAENRQLWRENGELKAQVAELKTKLDNLAPPVSKQPHENSAKTA